MSDTMEISTTVESTGAKARPYAFSAPAMVWHDALLWMNENSDAGIRRAVTKDLAAECDVDKLEDNEEVVTIRPTAKSAPEVAQALTQLGLEVDLSTVPEAERPAGAARTRTPKEPTFCEFSGEPTSGGRFRPGYDMRLRGALTRIIDNPALSDTDEIEVGTGNAVRSYTVQGAIDRLVELKWYTEDNLNERRQKALTSAQEKEAARERRETEAAERKAAKAAEKAAAATAA